MKYKTARQIWEHREEVLTEQATGTLYNCFYLYIGDIRFEIFVDWWDERRCVLYVNANAAKYVHPEFNSRPMFNTVRQVKKCIRKELKRLIKADKERIERFEEALQKDRGVK